MQTFLLMLLVCGLVVLHKAQGKGKCSYAGVVHLEGGGRYSLTFQEAQQLCQSFRYHLATEEQLKQAYEQGLKTCRYGWIDGQKVSFLPHPADPNCSLIDAEMVSHVESPASHYDVYCFNPSGSLEVDCEGTSTSTPHASFSSWPTQESISTTAKPHQDENIFDEAMADGFIVNIKGTTLPVKNQKPQDNYKASTTPNTINVQHSSSLTPQEDSVSMVAKYPKMIALTMENPKEATSKSATMKTTIPDFGVKKIKAPTELTTKGTTDKAENTNMEGSGMSPKTLHEKASRHFIFPATVHSPGRILSTSTLLLLSREEEAGSGVEPEGNDDIPVNVISSRKLGKEGNEPATRAPSQVRNPNHATASPAEEGTPGWLIICAFCLTLGAILCVLVGIATKDMWYKPRRRGLDSTPRGNTTEEYGKTLTLPMGDKEQEMVTLMSPGNGQKNNGDTLISLEELPEKEYLM